MYFCTHGTTTHPKPDLKFGGIVPKLETERFKWPLVIGPSLFGCFDGISEDCKSTRATAAATQCTRIPAFRERKTEARQFCWRSISGFEMCLGT